MALLHEPFEVDQRRGAVGAAAALGEAALCVEAPGTVRGVEGVEADGIAATELCLGNGRLE